MFSHVVCVWATLPIILASAAAPTDMRLVRKFRDLRDELGRAVAGLYLLDLAGLRFGSALRVYHYKLLAQPVRGPILPSRWARRYKVSAIDAQAADPAQLGVGSKVLEHRFAQNATCLAAFDGLEVVGCLWLCPNGYVEDEVRAVYLPIPSGTAAWDFGLDVDPRYRGGLVFAALWDAGNAWLARHGFAWSLSRVSGFNARSLAAHKRLGAREIGGATFLRFGRWQLCVSSLGPRFHVSAGDTQMPVIRIPVPACVSEDKQR